MNVYFYNTKSYEKKKDYFKQQIQSKEMYSKVLELHTAKSSSPPKSINYVFLHDSTTHPVQRHFTYFLSCFLSNSPSELKSRLDLPFSSFLKVKYFRLNEKY